MTWYPLGGQFADLVNTPPDTAAGTALGVGDWRLVIDAVLPASPGGYWSIGSWDEVDWNVIGWVDITAHVRGLTTRRGADEPFGEPRTGTATITVESPDDLFSPWNPSTAFGDAFAFFAPGTLIRVGLRSATDTRADGWLPLFAGTVELWPIATAGVGADRWCDVQLVEPIAELAGLQVEPEPVAEGEGDTISDRAVRALTRLAWRYGLVVTAGDRGVFTLPATTFTGAALDDLADAALGTDTEIMGAATGSLRVAARHHADAVDHEPGRLAAFTLDDDGLERVGIADRPLSGLSGPGDDPGAGDLTWLAYNADAFITGNDVTALANRATWTGPTDTPQTHTVPESAVRWLDVSAPARAVPATSDAQVLELVTRHVERRARNLLRVDAVELTADRPEPVDGLLVAAAIDIGDPCTVTPPGIDPADIDTDPHVTGHIRSIEHNITPAGPAGAAWRTVLAVDTGTVHNILGAQL